LDGIYVFGTSSAEHLSAADAVRGYKSLAQVERLSQFERPGSVDSTHSPSHRGARASTYVLCLLAYCVEWHLRRVWAPLLFEDEELPKQRSRRDPVLPAQESVQLKKLTHQTADRFRCRVSPRCFRT
jgi:hypothetical protein